MATSAADDLNALDQLLATAGQPASTLTAGSTVADYSAALTVAYGAVKDKLDAMIASDAVYDSYYGTSLAAQARAQETQATTLYQAALASVANAAAQLTLGAALDPASLPATSEVAPLPYSGTAARTFADAPSILRETDYNVAAGAAFTRSGATGATFVSPAISADFTQVGSSTYPDGASGANATHQALVDAAKQLVGEAMANNALAGDTVNADDVRNLGNAMDVTLTGKGQLLADLASVLAGSMTLAAWLAEQQSWAQQDQAAYGRLAAAAVSGTIGGVGWVLSPLADKVHAVTIEQQGTASYQLAATLEAAAGSGAANTLVLGGNQHNEIQLGTGSSAAVGGDAGNTFTVGAGDDVVIGGKGLDVVVLAATHAASTITPNADGSITVSSSTPGGAAADTVVNVERVQFADGTLALDFGAGQVAGEAYRIYQAAFGRTPDTAGLKYWVGVMDAGASLDAVAAAFVGSAEFQQAYGANAVNADVVTKFYANVLGRAPDAAGDQYWVGVLDDGAARGEVLAAFSESAENQAKALGVIDHGIWLG